MLTIEDLFSDVTGKTRTAEDVARYAEDVRAFAGLMLGLVESRELEAQKLRLPTVDQLDYLHAVAEAQDVSTVVPAGAERLLDAACSVIDTFYRRSPWDDEGYPARPLIPAGRDPMMPMRGMPGAKRPRGTVYSVVLVRAEHELDKLVTRLLHDKTRVSKAWRSIGTKGRQRALIELFRALPASTYREHLLFIEEEVMEVILDACGHLLDE